MEPLKVNTDGPTVSGDGVGVSMKMQQTDLTLNKKERESLGFYQGSGYQQINTYMRGSGSANEQEHVDQIDKIMARSVLGRQIKVTRGLSKWTQGTWAATMRTKYGVDVSDPAALVGKRFEDTGYASTSFGKGFANGQSDAITLNITVPKGSSAVSLNHIEGYESTHPGEKEILLARGTEFEITGYAESPNGHHVFDVSVVGQRKIGKA